jgi:curved DNA-binding protein
MNVKDYYGVLGVNRKAGPEDIRTAFRHLAMRYHPDRNPESAAEAEAKFKELNEAHDVLGDTYKRWQYDRLIRVHDYTRKAEFANDMSGQANDPLEMLLKLEDLGLAAGLGRRQPGGCGCRKGRRCRWQ